MKLSKPPKGRAFPLQLLLVLPFLLQIFGTVGLVGFLSFKNGQKAVNDLADRLIDRTGRAVDQHLDNYLAIPHKVIQMNADAVKMGLLDVRDREEVGRYFWHQMQIYDLTYIGMGLTTGEGVGAGRYDGKTLTIDDWSAQTSNNWSAYATDNQGNRTELLETLEWSNFSESWYLEPINAGKALWSRFYTINYPGYPYIAASAGRPIYDAQNRLLGMVSADIHLLRLSEFLRELDVSATGKVFILDRDGLLIASSSEQEPFVVRNGEIQRINGIDSPDPVVKSVTQSLQKQLTSFRNINDHQELHVEDAQGESYYVQVTPWQDKYGLDWIVVVTVPESAFMAQINANTRTSILLCIAALAIASVVGILTARWITRPIHRLNAASEAMASGDLEQTVEESGIQELNRLARSFNYMAGQLRETFAALAKSNEDLEDRVDQRTAELKQAMTELQRTQAQVIQSEKMSSLGQLVAGVAHEINNPVNFIHGNLVHIEEYTQDLLGFVSLYQDHYPNPEAEIQEEAEAIDLEFMQADLPKMLSSMKMGTDRIRQIVLSLRNFSRMDEAEIKPVDIHEGIDSTLMILQHRLKARPERPEVQVVKEYGNLPLVECYAGQLNQVFMNILTNAIDALEESNASRSYQDVQSHPNRITVRTRLRDDQWVEIAIADNGPGIPREIQQRIFNPFFTTKPIGKGTGMGMSISYQIVTEKHHGRLDCFSMPDQGTEFIIQIPVRQAAALMN
ncbi:ATP-binding protein [Geitlerinema sp. PCC 7407]|uniref:ATP-binding protein n=1 Tax=Geitlerinema sp. PCC 7407 TaxID=1173025 RepID=UPI00029FD526|nr:ATP-binding protein [Geitlerinema sp. PCC 7407]AFY65896.1 multi-sensor signal transduction histidine kinase [Geitlerinema sp. PCC 7407]